MKDKVQFKVHRNPTHNHKELVVRVAEIANGYVIKAGGAPLFCKSLDEARDAVMGVLTEFEAT